MVAGFAGHRGEDGLLAAYLATLEPFTRLGADAVSLLAEHMHERRYQSGAVIFYEGDRGEAVWWVRRGRVKVFRTAPDGREQIMQIWGPGSPFGLVVLLDNGPYPASAQAVDDSTVLMLPVAAVAALEQQIPGLRGLLTGEAGRRLRRVQERAHNLSVRGVAGNIARLLLDMIGSGERVAEGVLVAKGLTHQDLGNMVGASRETVTRVLGDFRRDGAVAATRSGIVITDEEKLQAWLDK